MVCCAPGPGVASTALLADKTITCAIKQLLTLKGAVFAKSLTTLWLTRRHASNARQFCCLQHLRAAFRIKFCSGCFRGQRPAIRRDSQILPTGALSRTRHPAPITCQEPKIAIIAPGLFFSTAISVYSGVDAVMRTLP